MLIIYSEIYVVIRLLKKGFRESDIVFQNGTPSFVV